MRVTQVASESAKAEWGPCSEDSDTIPAEQRWVKTASPYLTRSTYASMWNDTWKKLPDNVMLTAETNASVPKSHGGLIGDGRCRTKYHDLNNRCRVNSNGHQGNPDGGDDDSGKIRIGSADYYVGGGGTISVYDLKLQCESCQPTQPPGKTCVIDGHWTDAGMVDYNATGFRECHRRCSAEQQPMKYVGFECPQILNIGGRLRNVMQCKCAPRLSAKHDDSIPVGTAITTKEDCLRLCQEQPAAAKAFTCRHFEYVPRAGATAATCKRYEYAVVSDRANGDAPLHQYYNITNSDAFATADRCRGPFGGSATTCTAAECCRESPVCANKRNCTTSPDHIKTQLGSKICLKTIDGVCTDDECGCRPTCGSMVGKQSFCDTDQYIPYGWRSNGTACDKQLCRKEECCAPVPKCGKDYTRCADERREIDIRSYPSGNLMKPCNNDKNDQCSDEECCVARKNCSSYTTCGRDPRFPASKHGELCEFVAQTLSQGMDPINVSVCESDHCCEARRRCSSHTCSVANERVPYAKRNDFCEGTPQERFEFKCTDAGCDCTPHVCGGKGASNDNEQGRHTALLFCRQLTAGFVSDWRPKEAAVGGVCNVTTQSGECDFNECCERVTSPPLCKDHYGGVHAKKCSTSLGPIKRCWSAHRANKPCEGYGDSPCDADTCCSTNCEVASAAMLMDEQVVYDGNNTESKPLYEKDEFRIAAGVGAVVVLTTIAIAAYYAGKR